MMTSKEWDRINDEFQKMIDAAPDDVKEEISTYLMDSLHTLIEWSRGRKRIPKVTRLSPEAIEFAKSYLDIDRVFTMHETILTIES